MYRIFILVLVILTSSWVFAADQDYQTFDKIFANWTAAFNKKDLTHSCNLFSKKLTADYQGAPKKTYASVCNGFKKIFSENRQYQYRYKLHHVYRSNDLAAVRITWYLRVTENDKVIDQVQDEGIDIFKQDANGDWKIVNYLGYPVK